MELHRLPNYINLLFSKCYKATRECVTFLTISLYMVGTKFNMTSVYIIETVLQRLHDKGLTLNKDEYDFGVSKITFMRFVISGKGIGLTEKSESSS